MARGSAAGGAGAGLKHRTIFILSKRNLNVLQNLHLSLVLQTSTKGIFFDRREGDYSELLLFVQAFLQGFLKG